MAFNEKFNKLLKETPKKKPFNYNISLEKIINLGSRIFCFKSRHYQWRKKIQTYGGM